MFRSHNLSDGWPSSLIRALELKAAVHLLGLHLVVLVHQVQLAVAQRHSFLVLPAYYTDRRKRRRWTLLTLRLSWRKVRSSPGWAVRRRSPPEVVGVPVFRVGWQEVIWKLVEHPAGEPLLRRRFGVIDWGGYWGGEEILFVIVQPQTLKLSRGSTNISPQDICCVGFVPLDTHRLTVGRWRAIGNWGEIDSPISRASPSWCRGLSSRSVAQSSSFRAQVGASCSLLIMTLRDLVDRVWGHSRCSLHTGDAVTRLAARVFGAPLVPLPVEEEKLKVAHWSSVDFIERLYFHHDVT